MNQNQELRIAWVMPITCIYWQAILKDFVQLFPQAKIFTGKIFASPWGWEKNLDIEVVGKFKVIKFKAQDISYGSKFALMSPSIISKLLKYKPQLIIADTFCLWTLLVLLTKFWGKWQVIIACEGSSPGVDFLNSPFRLWIRRLIVRMADAYITNTKSGKDYLVNILYAPPSKVFTYPYLVPDAQFFINHFNEIEYPPLKTIYKSKIATQLKPDKQILNNIFSKQPIFLFVGRLIPRKGIHILLEACLILKQKGYTNYSLMVIGEGEQKEKLEQFCQANQLEKYVQWIGKVDYKSIGTYFNQADILVLPCLEDTWGMVVIEAILCGKAVVCSNGAGASEIIAQNQNGYVFEPQNPLQLAQLMANLIDNPNLLTAMQQKSQKIAANYTPKLAANFLAEKVYFCLKDKKIST